MAERNMDSQIEDLMNKAVNHALQIGAIFAEVRGEGTSRENRRSGQRNPHGFSCLEHRDCMRVFHSKANGFPFSNVLDEENVFRAVDKAMEIVKASTKTAHRSWVGSLTRTTRSWVNTCLAS